MTDIQRIDNLEKRVNALFDIVNRNQYYTNADINGTRQSISDNAKDIADITPYTATKTAYIDDTTLTFENVPQGNLTVFCEVEHTAERQADRVVIHFEALEEVTEITIMIQ